MKIAFSKFVIVGACALLFFAAFGVSSCKKDKTCRGTVYVKDTAGAAVAEAVVLLDTPSGDVTYTGTTDGSGKVLFEVALPAIFDVKATKETFPGMTGVGVIRLDEPGTEDEVTVTIQ